MTIKNRIDCANAIAGLRLRLPVNSEIAALELPKSTMTKIKWEFMKNSNYTLGSDIQIDGVDLLEIPDGERPAWILRFPFALDPPGDPGDVMAPEIEQEDAA